MEPQEPADGTSYVKHDWQYVRTLLPEALDESAERTHALRRRRGVNSAAALLRMLLAYSAGDLSLKDVAAWGKGLKISTLSTEALFYRVRDAERWLAELLADQLSREFRPLHCRLRLRIVDATVLTGPGATGTEWRLHALWDAQAARLVGLQLTDETVGEGYGLHDVVAGDVVLGDRGYAYARSIDAAVAKGADVTVRFNPETLRLCSADRQPLKLQQKKNEIVGTEPHSWSVLLPVPPPKTASHKSWRLADAVAWHPSRVVVSRTRTGELIWLLTTLREEQAEAHDVMSLYRLRWQIELAFKRLKSLSWLDSLPTGGRGPTAKSWIYGRLLLGALAMRLADPSGALSPWGYEIPRS